MTRRRRHRPACRHCFRVRLLGVDFAGWRSAHDEAREAETGAYPAELAERDAADPRPTFRCYLEAMTGSGWPMSGSVPRGILR